MNTRHIVQSLRIVRSILCKDRPLYVHYGITHRCNLRCPMCFIDQQDAGYELSLPEIDTLFDFLKKLGVLYVSLGGGEPGVREDLPQICEQLIKKGFRVRLLTNGTSLSRKVLLRLASCGLREMSVSLHTLDNGRSEAIYGCPGAVSGILRTIDWLPGIFPGKGRGLLLNTVVSSLNIDELPALYEFAASKGFLISFIPVEGRTVREQEFFRAHEDVLDRSYDYLIRCKRAGGNILNSSRFLESSRRYFKTGARLFDCDAGKLYLSVGPDGGIAMCHRFAPVMGRGSWDHIKLLSRDFKEECRRKARECSGCVRPCWGELSFLARDGQSFWEMARLQGRMLR